MAICEACGTEFPNSRKSCPQCGEEVDFNSQQGAARRDNYRRKRDRGGYSDGNPAYVYSTPKDRLPMTTGSFLGSLIMMGIPIIGLIVQIMWSLGGASNVNRKNLARAYLIFSIIRIVILFAIAFLAYDYVSDFISNFPF